jgi:hypothetical protein
VEKNHFHQANHKGFVSSRNVPSTLTGTQQSIIFPASTSLGLVVRLPQPLSAGVAAQTLTLSLCVRVLSPKHHLQCTVRSLGESHHESLASSADLLEGNQTPPLNRLCIVSLPPTYHSIILYHAAHSAASPAKSQFQLINSREHAQTKGNAASMSFCPKSRRYF